RSEMGIFSAGSGGLFVAAAGSLELAGIIFRTADDSLDLLGDPCLCILQEFCADRLILGFRFGVLHVAAAGQPADHGCSFADAGTGCQAPWQSLRVLISSIPTFVGASSEVHVWGV